ncbi:MAG: M67 family metallopeptidase [Anaerolineales bacterium]|nr:M67 family metallopeptidase [Anaerolineales bacterium]
MDTTSNSKISKFFIPSKIWESMQEHAARDAPLEACGLVSGRTKKGSFQAISLIPTTNILHSSIRYQIDPHEQLNAFNEMEAGGLELVAIYHSHPHGPEVPSPIDIKEAYYPDTIHLIWSARSGAWNCRGFLIHNDTVREVGLIITM